MCLHNETSTYTKNYWEKINRATELIQDTETLFIGVGSGMTASGGISYTDPMLAKKWYPEYFSLGYQSIAEIMGRFWPTTLREEKAQAFWGFWVKHIFHLRYELKALSPYLDLFDIAKGKNYFICSTNVDGQLEKAGFPSSFIFAPQGDYGLFQCAKPCSDNVYPNQDMIDRMIKNMPSPFEIRKEDIPRCPKCGGLLMPNLRCDQNFVEQPHMGNIAQYESFIKNSIHKKIVLLELGVGFNTPGIIRIPFEQIAAKSSSAVLIRVNTSDFQKIIKSTRNNILEISQDIGMVLKDVKVGILQ